MTARSNQPALDRLADVLVEDILNTPEEQLLAEVAEDYRNPRALAQTFDKIALRARSNNDRLVSRGSPAAATALVSGSPRRRKHDLAERLKSGWRNAIPSILDAIFPSRLIMVTVSSACIATLAFIAAAPTLFDWMQERPSGGGVEVFDGGPAGPRLGASPQERGGAGERGLTRGLRQPTPGGYVAQIAMQRTKEDAEASVRNLQTQFAKELGDHKAIIRPPELGANGVFYRTLVGPFGSADDADRFCSSLKAAGGQCTVQKE